jgi:hypothetical protein
MADTAATKARLIAKRTEKKVKEHDLANPLLAPILEYLKNELEYVDDMIPKNTLTLSEMKDTIEYLERKEVIEKLIVRVSNHQNPKHSPGPMNIYIFTIYLLPDLFDYGLKYDPTNDCDVSQMYKAIGKVLCNWSG